MTVRLFSLAIFLLIALVLQFWFAGIGIFLNLSFAVLITSALILEFPQLFFLLLLEVFIINWQPTASLEILVFLLIPVIIHYVRNIFKWQLWIENFAAIILGFLILYLAISPESFFSNFGTMIIDMIGGLLIGSLTFYLFAKTE